MKKTKKQTNPTIETIRKLTRMGIENQFAHTGNMPKVLTCFTGNQTLHVIPHLPDDEAKDKFAEYVRLLCTAEAVDAMVFVSEVWVGKDLSVRPSEQPDRQEAVVASIEMRGHPTEFWFYPINRNPGEKPKLGEPQVFPETAPVGRFTRLLPPEPPTEGQRIIAAYLLELQGYNFQRKHATWN